MLSLAASCTFSRKNGRTRSPTDNYNGTMTYFTSKCAYESRGITHVPNSGDPAKVYSSISEMPVAAIQIPTDTTSTTCYAIASVGYDPGPPKSGGPADFEAKFLDAVTTTPHDIYIYRIGHHLLVLILLLLYSCSLYQARIMAFNYQIAAQKFCGAIDFWANLSNHGHHDRHITYDLQYVVLRMTADETTVILLKILSLF